MKTSIKKLKRASFFILLITLLSINLFGNQKEKEAPKKEEVKKESSSKSNTSDSEKKSKKESKSTEKISFFKDGISINVNHH